MKDKFADNKQNLTYYFSHAKDEIALINLTTLRVASSVGLAMLFALILITPKLLPDWRPTLEYFLLAPVLAAFIVFSFLYGRKKMPSYTVIQIACVIFFVCLMSLFIAISVFPYPLAPETFVSLCIMLLPVMFIIPPHVVSILIFAAGIVFSVMSALLRPWEAAGYDIFATLTAVLFSHVVVFVTYNLRAGDYSARMKYLTLSMTDQLTGMLNKRACEDNCRTYLENKNADETCALFIFDVDDLKNVNDNLGHPVGDELLECIGAVLTRSFRSTDIVGRIGGDEFCALMKNVHNQNIAEKKALSILAQIKSETLAKLGKEYTVSVGVAVCPREPVTFRAMFTTADNALYNSKRAGKNRCVMTLLSAEAEQK